MSISPRYAAPVLVLAGLTMSLLVAPIAAADGADTAIDDLQAQGYTVQINYLNGASEELSYCSVVNVERPRQHAPTSLGDNAVRRCVLPEPPRLSRR